MHEVISVVWEENKTHEKWRKGLIVKLPKKGNLKECDNWCKVMERTGLNRLDSDEDHYIINTVADFIICEFHKFQESI